MSKKRSDMEIYADILKVATGGARKSHIVYKANLNFKIVKKYLSNLRESGLITDPENESKLYRTTEKGLKYLDHFEGLKDYMAGFGFAS